MTRIKTLLSVFAVTLLMGFSTVASAKAEVFHANFDDSSCYSSYYYTYCWTATGNWHRTTTPSGNVIYHWNGTRTWEYTNNFTGDVFSTGSSKVKNNYLIKKGDPHRVSYATSTEACVYGEVVFATYDYHFVNGEVIRYENETDYTTEPC